MRGSLQAGLFLAFLGLYLVAGSREELWGDPKAAYRVAERLVSDGKIDIGYPWPGGSRPAPDGKYYSPYATLPSLVQVPAAALQYELRRHWPAALPLSGPLAGHLVSALFGALTCLLFYRMCCLRLGVSPGVAAATTAVLGVATMMFPYARDPFSEMLQTLCYTGLVSAMLAVLASPLRRHALALGAWAGLLYNCKPVLGVALPGAAILLAVLLRRDLRRLVVTGALAAAAFLPFALLALGWNYLRSGGLGEPAMAGNSPLFTQRMLWGLMGYLFSTGKSVFLFSPPLVVAAFGVPALWRRHRTVALAVACTALPVVAVYSKYVLWNGDQAWGPRYLLFLHPVAMLPFAVLLQAGLRRVSKAVVVAFVVAGVGVQILGSALWRGHFIRMAREVDDAWLGKPNASGSVLQPCMSCFEHLYANIWLPPFAAVDGHLWLLRHLAFGDSWAEADRDAPWRQYTTLPFDESAIYDHVRIDWWALLWLKDFPKTFAGGLAILLVELALLAGGVWLWLRRGP